VWARAAWAALGLQAAESKGARYSAEPPFRRSCIGLPGLKWGTCLSGTTTSAPVFGFRPGRPGLTRTVNAPIPRNSTRSPRAIAAIISSKMVLTIFSASLARRCGFIPATRWISSLFSTAAPFCWPNGRKPQVVKSIHPKDYADSRSWPGRVVAAIGHEGKTLRTLWLARRALLSRPYMRWLALSG
jgi:hypothetical protein